MKFDQVIISRRFPMKIPNNDKTFNKLSSLFVNEKYFCRQGRFFRYFFAPFYSLPIGIKICLWKKRKRKTSCHLPKKPQNFVTLILVKNVKKMWKNPNVGVLLLVTKMELNHNKKRVSDLEKIWSWKASFCSSTFCKFRNCP